MSTNLDIEQIFPNFSLVESAATKAAIANAIEVSGASDADSFTITIGGVTTTLTMVSTLGGAGATEIQIVRSGTAGTDRDRVRKAINGTEDTNVAFGSNLDAAEGVQGVKAANGTGTTLSVEAETAGASTITLANATGTIASAGSDTGTDATGTIQIPLSDFAVSGNELTLAEAQGSDFRKLAYHFVRKLYDYLVIQDSVASVAITSAGAGYTAGAALTFSGGTPTRAAAGTVATVDGSGAITGINISDAGEGYDGVPNVSVAGGTTTATLTATLTDNYPTRLSVSRSSISESGGILSRTYSLIFGFAEGGLELAAE
jgi:hypothetical protein